MATNDELKELNEELRKADLEPLGDVAHEDEGSGDESVQSADVEEIPKLDEFDEDAKGDDAEDETGDDSQDDDADDDQGDESGDGDGDRTPNPDGRQHIPYSQYAEEKKAWKEREEFWKKQAEQVTQGGKKPDAPANDQNPIVTAASDLAKELGLDQKKSELLLTKVVELAKAQAIPKELMDRLNAIEARGKEIEEREAFEAEQTYFNSEWNSFVPTLKSQFPNASVEQLNQAKAAMDIIAHSTRFAKIPDLEYIFSKTKDDFADILFSPKKKTFEQGRRSQDESGRREVERPDIGSETPEAIAALEESLFGSEDGNDLTFFDEHGKAMRH